MQFVVLGIVIMVSLPASVQIWGEVSRKISELRTSSNDNVTWNLTQLEVEFLKLERSLDRAQRSDSADAAQLDDLRLRFDIYFSRLETLHEGPLYQEAFSQFGSEGLLQRLRAEAAELAVIFDQGNALLFQSLAHIERALQSRERDVRRIITRGNQHASIIGQGDRDELGHLLLQLSIASLVLFFSLGISTLLIFRQSRLQRARALEHKRSSARFSAVISTSPDALIVTDDAGLIVEFNRAAEELVKIQRANVLGRRFTRYLLEQDGQLADLPLRHDARVAAVEFILRNSHGDEVPVELSQGVAALETQRFYVYFLRDISDRKAADAALLASRDRALAGERAKSRFLAVMSHEMRTPLNGILGLVELMRDSESTEEERLRYLELTRSSGQILLDHVNDVLDIAQLEADGVKLNPRPFDLDQLLSDLMGSMEVAADGKGNKIYLEKAEDALGWFHGDGARLRQVLMNLIGNAVKFTENGSVHVAVAASSLEKGGLWHLEFQISDTGAGIADEDVNRIFDDFVRLEQDGDRQAEGTGLGLGIAKRIVQSMGGQIGVDSLLGEGSTFWITIVLPEARPDDLGLPIPQPKATRIGVEDSLKVLVVEDNPTNRLVVRDLLERDGHEVFEANNGRVGLHMAQETHYDVILMDLNMPVMGGLEAATLIRQDSLCQNSRIVALTAHVMERDDRLYHEAGLDDLLSKPLERNDLRRALLGEEMVKPAKKQGDVLVDRPHLTQVLTALGPDRGRALLKGLAVETDSLLRALQTPDADRDALSVTVHSIAGSCAMVGTQMMRDALNTLESALLEDDTVDCQEWHDMLLPVWQDTKAVTDRIADKLFDAGAS